MKKYYDTLNREGKLEIKELYKSEYKESDLKVRLMRLKVYAVLSYIMAIVLYIEAFTQSKGAILNIIIATVLVIVATIFVIGVLVIKKRVLNKLALKNKKAS